MRSPVVVVEAGTLAAVVMWRGFQSLHRHQVQLKEISLCS